MDMLEIESAGAWVKTGKMWTHVPTGAQRFDPPNFAFHAMTEKGDTKKVETRDIEGIFILGATIHDAGYIYSVLIGIIGEWPIPCVLDDNVIGALNSWSLIDNPEEVSHA